MAPESDFAAASAAAASYLSFNPSAFMSMAMEAVTNFMESGETGTNPVSNACQSASLLPG